MAKWWVAILIAIALADAGFAQNNRVKLDPELHNFADPLNAVDETSAAQLASQFLLPAVPGPASGYQAVGGILAEYVASARYESAFAEYRRLIGEQEAKLAGRSDGAMFRDAQTLAHEWLARLPRSILERYQKQIDPDAAPLL